jgi:small-conductance mechanosensitive channel
MQPSVSDVGDAIDTSQISGWDFLISLLVIVVTIPLSKGVAWIAGRLARRSGAPSPAIRLIKGVVRAAVILVGAAISVSILGISVEGFAVVIFFVGLIAVLMLRPLVENFSAGLLLELRGSFVVGDEIKSNAYEGEVKEMVGRTIVLKTRDGRRVAIPSTEVLSNPIVIYTGYELRRSSLTAYIAYETDLDVAEDALLAAAKSVDGVLDEPAPEVRGTDFADGVYLLELHWWHGPRLSDEAQARDKVIRAAKRELDAAKVTMSGPDRIIVRQPDIPEEET